MYATGLNANYQLGTSDTTNRLTFSDPVLLGVKTVTCGFRHSFAIKTDGTLWFSGDNNKGQLGTGDKNQRGWFTQDFSGNEVLSGVKAVACGNDHTLVLKLDGTLWVTGANYDYGQLGSPVHVADRASFFQVLSNVNAVACGNWFSLALMNNGTLWSTGRNLYGELGRGHNFKSYAFREVLSGVKAIACGKYHSLALKTDDTLWAAGRNGIGQLGDGTQVDKTLFVQVLSEVKEFAGGGAHSLALKTNGTLWATGHNVLGQLGDGTLETRNSFTQILIGGLTDIKAVACGENHSFVLNSDNTVWAAGYNNIGQLGDGTLARRVSFKKIVSNVRTIFNSSVVIPTATTTMPATTTTTTMPTTTTTQPTTLTTKPTTKPTTKRKKPKKRRRPRKRTQNSESTALTGTLHAKLLFFCGKS